MIGIAEIFGLAPNELHQIFQNRLKCGKSFFGAGVFPCLMRHRGFAG